MADWREALAPSGKGPWRATPALLRPAALARVAVALRRLLPELRDLQAAERLPAAAAAAVPAAAAASAREPWASSLG